MKRVVRLAGPVSMLVLSMLLVGCLTPPPAAHPAAPLPPPPGLTDLLERPAERALFDGMKAYDDGQYTQAEARLQAALKAPLASPRDRASAWKLLAFMHCAAGRTAECEAAFRDALAADPTLQLSRSEAGHPAWAPVWQRLRPARP
ncbi:MAG: TssQ family T6SS-associated lipoprotein [Rubrivivax sp.]|jgi:Tfp pilus assembly protein PilF